MPTLLLRKGTNVLSLEIHHTAVPPDFLKAENAHMDYARWSKVGLLEVQLTTSIPQGLVPNVSRPQGLQVWHANLPQVVTQMDYGDPHDALLPLRIVGTRNGTFSGQVVVGSDKVLEGLRVEVTPLKRRGGSGTISTSDIEIRYPLPCPGLWATKSRHPGVRVQDAGQFDGLTRTPPAEVPVRVKAEADDVIPGAVQPIWVTVRVPAGTPAGVYEGKLSIHTEGAQPIEVTIEVTVSGWKLPDPGDYHTLVDFVQSPESVALRYDVPLWSGKHFELMNESVKLLAQVGNKTIYIPLITRTNHGNEQSMVRWTRQSEGSYQADFSIVERYLDLFQKNGVKPQVVCFQVWDYHIGGTAGIWYERWGAGGYNSLAPKEFVKVPVSALDPATGKIEQMEVSEYGTPEARTFWAPVAEELLERMKRRGLQEVMMLGISADQPANKQVVELWHELLPSAKCVTMTHHSRPLLHGVPVGYATMVYGTTFGIDPAVTRFHGWKRPDLVAYFPRLRTLPLPSHRLFFEWNIQGNQRGMGRLAADFFTVEVAGSHPGRLSARYPQSEWRNLNLREPWLAPGPEGPISTVRFALAREGIQECEARIFIEKALTNKVLRARLGEEIAGRCQAILDERTRHNQWANEFSSSIRTFLPGGPLGFDWYAGSGWQERSQKLYAAATEVAQALEK